MLVSIEKLQYYLKQAQERKNDIKDIYNKVLDLTDPFSSIKDSGEISKIGVQRPIDSAVSDSIDALTSFIMSSILTRTGRWADVSIDEATLLDQDEGAQKSIDEANAILEEDTDKVFRYIQSSNYYQEISRAVKCFVKLGTGVFSIRETGSTSKPFIYNYIGLDNLYILEDSMSKPSIVFKLHPSVNATYIEDLFVNSIIPNGVSLDDPSATINVYECVVPTYDEKTTTTVYNYMVLTEDLETVIKEQVLDYNVFNVFRWDVIEGSPWGKSIVLDNIQLLEELEGYKEIFKTQARRIASPSAIFFGNMELFHSISLEEGAMNYGGNPQAEGVQGSLQSLGGNSNLMPLDKLIDSARMMFRQSLMVDNLVMNTEQGKNVTA